MKIYQVGGAVRDALLGLPVKDIDYVVVGSSPLEMIQAGFTPVGKDFPVFLHPATKAEYALARTERKSAPGYHGFVFHCAPDVTLEEDLKRRDLTINAMAVAEESAGRPGQTIIDPFGGQRDLADKIFRHVSDAFTEDPVRILRVARFAARFSEFVVASETMQLMRTMVKSGEVDALVPQRVWQELSRGLMEQHPSRMFEVLFLCGAIERILPEFVTAWHSPPPKSNPIRAALDFAAQQNQSLSVRWAVALIAALDPLTGQPPATVAERICLRFSVPTEVSDIAQIAIREHRVIHDVATRTATQTVDLLERCDAIRRPARFHEIVAATRCFFQLKSTEFAQQSWLSDCLAAVRTIPAGDIARRAAEQFPNQKDQIATHIFAARVQAVESIMSVKN